MELELGDVELPELVQVCLSMFDEKASQKNLTVKKEIAPGLPSRIRADKRKLKQILFNLLSNAVKFTPDGGVVTVRVSRREDSGEADSQSGRSDHESGTLDTRGEEANSQSGGPDSQSDSSDPQSDGPDCRSGEPHPRSGRSGSQSGGYLQVEVEDTGIGISPEDQGKIFQEFYQVEAPLTKQYEGTGLGLALCRHLVKLHGGHIWFRSEKGSGSSFFFTIPLEIDDS